MKYIALSFDDGPCPVSSHGGTRALLSILKDLEIKATFFVIGNNVKNNKEEAAIIFNEGHELANHSNDYFPIANLTTEEITLSLDSATNIIKEITGKAPVLFRAPYLEHSDNLSYVCKQNGFPLIDGSVHNDWPGDENSILNSVIKNPQDGDIIVLHENNTSHANTMNVLVQIAENLRKNDFEIVTVSRLAEIKGRVLNAGERYSNIN